MRFLDILVIFRLDLSQITFNWVENTFAAQQLAFLPPASCFSALWLGHAQKSKFWDSFWTGKWHVFRLFDLWNFFLPFLFLLFSCFFAAVIDLLPGLLTYLRLVPLLAHRPPTRVLQLSLSWAFLFSWLQVIPSLLVSASKSRLHKFLGRPLFLSPCGFQARARLVMLVKGFRRVWPIHRQRLIMISASAGLWLVLCHRSSLLMVIGQRIRKILHRHGW